MGATVFLISGPSNESVKGLDVEIKKVISADEMYDECVEIFPNVDICIMSAAVSDYKPENINKEKIKKDNHSNLNLNLAPNKDIISHLAKMKNKNQKIIGFALETNNELENAKSKLVRKKLDAIVMNSLNHEGAGFDFDTNQVTFITETKLTELITVLESKYKNINYHCVYATIENFLNSELTREEQERRCVKLLQKILGKTKM